MPNPMWFGHDVCHRYIPQQNQLAFVTAKWLQREVGCWTIGVWMATSREIEDSMIGDDIVFGINVIRVVGRERWWLEGGHGQT